MCIHTNFIVFFGCQGRYIVMTPKLDEHQKLLSNYTVHFKLGSYKG